MKDFNKEYYLKNKIKAKRNEYKEHSEAKLGEHYREYRRKYYQLYKEKINARYKKINIKDDEGRKEQ